MKESHQKRDSKSRTDFRSNRHPSDAKIVQRTTNCVCLISMMENSIVRSVPNWLNIWWISILKRVIHSCKQLFFGKSPLRPSMVFFKALRSTKGPTSHVSRAYVPPKSNWGLRPTKGPTSHLSRAYVPPKSNCIENLAVALPSKTKFFVFEWIN